MYRHRNFNTKKSDSKLIIRLRDSGGFGVVVKEITVPNSLKYHDLYLLCKKVQQMHDDNMQMDIDTIVVYALL